jgi:hypothetical protein
MDQSLKRNSRAMPLRYARSFPRKRSRYRCMTVTRQAQNAENTKANSDVGELPIAKRRDRKRPDRSPSAGACFRCRFGIARKRGSRRSARARVDAGGMRRRGSTHLRSGAGIGCVEITGRAKRTTKMISKNLSRRLERSETTVMPSSNPVEMIIQFYSPEKVVTSTMTLEVDLPAPQSPKRQSWR